MYVNIQHKISLNFFFKQIIDGQFKHQNNKKNRTNVPHCMMLTMMMMNECDEIQFN